MANVALAKAIKKAITEKPELWDQHKWAAVPQSEFDPESESVSCGTTLCLAGWACHLSGEKIDWRTAESSEGAYVAHQLTNGRSIEGRAIELLEIDEEDGGHLFYAYSSETALDHLEQVIEHGEVRDPYRLED